MKEPDQQDMRLPGSRHRERILETAETGLPYRRGREGGLGELMA